LVPRFLSEDDVSDEFNGTTAVHDRHRFDTGPLEAYLSRHIDGFRGPIDAAQFKGGQSNPTFLLVTPTGRYVMRTKPAPAAKLLPSAHAIEREFRVMSALGSAGFPVPRMHVLCVDEGVIGRAFYVMEHIAGRVLWEQSLPGMAPAERAAVYDEMNRVIAALHAIEPAQVALADFGRPGNYFSRQIDRWTKQYRASATESIAAMDRLIEWLPAHVPPGEETSIVHGDFRLDNLIFSTTEPRIVAVLDWELSTLGHPLADFAYHCMSWHIPPGHFRGISGLDLAALGIPQEPEYIASYCRRTGRTHIDHWDFYLAYNLFRVAAILQGVMRRALDGTAASEQALDAGRRARPLAELGWIYAQRAGAHG